MREIASERYKDLTSPSLLERRSRLIEARQELADLERKRSDLNRQATRITRRLKRARGWLRWFADSSIDRLEAQDREVMFEQHRLEERAAQLEQESKYEFDEEAFDWHQKVAPHFDRLSRVQRIWDITHHRGETHYKSSASETIQRKPVRLFQNRLPAIHPEMNAFCFGNVNGPDLYIFPGLIVVANSAVPNNLALIRFSDCEFFARDTRFQETESVPSDAEVIDYAWQYVNKDGSPDRRFSYNPQIPVCHYGEMTVSSTTGLNETFQFSDLSAMVAFVKAMQAQQSASEPAISNNKRSTQFSSGPGASGVSRYHGERDELFDDAAKVIVHSQQGSVSLLQRKLSVGYTRAARIVDQLEAAGVVGPFEGSAARQVLIAEESMLDILLYGKSKEEDQ